QYVYNDERVKNCFDSQLWVSATPQSGVRDFLVKIISFVTGENPVNCEMAQLHLQFSRAMREIAGKRVLTTTCSEAVVDVMGITDPYMLREIAENDSWLLLQYFALTRGQELELGVEAIGKEIAKMCPKNPLGIKALAFLMEDRVMQTLKLSYDDLDNNLKRCAAYCSLFPKGESYHTEITVRIWMALGFVELEDAGEDRVRSLVRCGFFEQMHHIRKFKMHDVMHDLNVMVKLRHLLLMEASNNSLSRNVMAMETITHMPKGIGNLTDLQELNLFVVIGEDSNTSSRSKGNVAADLAELGRLNNTCGWAVQVSSITSSNSTVGEESKINFAESRIQQQLPRR
uniref:Disease resistance protein winged helix domain-containing protein n=1 Tax=Chenopodium quinoa TaxID=63459 RepID=A0A803L2E8_CHEQI